MYEINEKRVRDFLDTFCLKIEKEIGETKNLIDPFGIHFVYSPNCIIFNYPEKKNSTETASRLDLKEFTHVIKSFDEFAEFWGCKDAFIDINYISRMKKPTGWVKLTLR